MIFENRSFFTFLSSRVWHLFVFRLWIFLKKNQNFWIFLIFGCQILFVRTKMVFSNKQNTLHPWEIESWKVIFSSIFFISFLIQQMLFIPKKFNFLRKKFLFFLHFVVVFTAEFTHFFITNFWKKKKLQKLKKHNSNKR